VKARDEGKGEAVSKQPPVVEEPRHPRNPPPPTHGYSRYDQERFKGKEGRSHGTEGRSHGTEGRSHDKEGRSHDTEGNHMV